MYASKVMLFAPSAARRTREVIGRTAKVRVCKKCGADCKKEDNKWLV